MKQRSFIRKDISLAVTVIAMIALVPFNNAAAQADTYSASCNQWPATQVPCRADDANMDYCTVEPWDPTIGQRFGEAMSNLDNQTDLYDTYMNPCGTQTDLGAHRNGVTGEVELPDNVLGMYICTKRMPSVARCDQASLIFNIRSSWLQSRTWGWNSTQLANARRNVLCHEIGHAVGVYHDTGVGGCMNSTLSTQVLYYPQHHVDHINAAH